MMRIGIDMQPVLAAWDDRDARTGLLFLVRQILLAGQGHHEVFLVASGDVPGKIIALRSEFADVLAPDRIRVWFRPPGGGAESAGMLIAALSALQTELILFPMDLDRGPGVCTLVEAERNCGHFRIVVRGPEILEPSRTLGWAGQARFLEQMADAVYADSEHTRTALGSAFKTVHVLQKNGLLFLAPLFESVQSEQARPSLFPVHRHQRPRLAYLSPLPPERSGISDYSSMLLPELTRFYEIEVVVEQQTVSDRWVVENFQLRSPEWFAEHARSFDRVLYHVGNSKFHEHMFALLERHPGVVMLHDFYLGHALSGMPVESDRPAPWMTALYRSHGWNALRSGSRPDMQADALWDYPVNLDVITNALGVLAHSNFAMQLADKWYGYGVSAAWRHIPLLRAPIHTDASRRAQVRAELALTDKQFVVCSFGVVGPLKLSDRILEAWLQSALGSHPDCVLVLVGEYEQSPYGRALAERARAIGCGRVHITGWVNGDRYAQYLCAADAAVQLRTRSRGESSAAVLDCLNFGLPTIINSHGSMTDLPADAVLAIPDVFSVQELTKALERLYADDILRSALSTRGRGLVAEAHHPSACAAAYADAIEAMYRTPPNTLERAIRPAIAMWGSVTHGTDEFALALDASIPRSEPVREILVDVSAICDRDLRTGIQRVVRSILAALIANAPPGYRIEPVRFTDEGGRWHARYARAYTSRLLGCRNPTVEDDVVAPDAGDVFLGLDLCLAMIVAVERSGLFAQWRARGVAVAFVVYDLLPHTMPEKFPASEIDKFREWMRVVASCDAAFCISKAVEDEFSDWRESQGFAEAPFHIGHFHLGADIDRSAPTRGRPASSAAVFGELGARPTLLMVGTVEPRKGHLQVLAAMDLLWAAGVDVGLAVVGKQGWQMESFAQRARTHPEFGSRLLWLDGISDEYLDEIYRLSACLLAASEGEGFGLPLIEAAQRGIPLIARDIPVFREVAGDHAFYFSGSDPEQLAEALRRWADLFRVGRVPESRGLPWLTWMQSAEQLKAQLAEAGLTRSPLPGDLAITPVEAS